MAWSTSQLAELAGSTVKAVRHYHKLGLLEEPDRRSNGYKQYRVAHLVRLLQITRLADLGVPLAKVAAMGRADQDPYEALRVIDAELETTIDKLKRIRGELALILTHRVPAELPTGFSALASSLSEADRSLVMIYSRVFDDMALGDLQRMHNEPRTALDSELDTLGPDADRATRVDLAERFAPQMRRLMDKYPRLADPASRAPHGSVSAKDTIAVAMRDLYNPAQLEVIYRAHLIAAGANAELAALDTALEEPH